MTEMSPVGSAGSIKPSQMALSHEEKLAIQNKQGWAPFGVEMKIVDDENNDLPWDGKRFGRLKVKGFAVAESYFKDEGGKILDENGFFDTGDVATIDPEGFMQITDRAKDVIKSGGEWISTIDIENLAVGHPDVAEAAVIGVAHPKWDERPLLVVVPKEGHSPKTEEVLEFLKPRIAKWWMPDDVQVVKEIPHTATGKINKLKLRETFKGYKLPTPDGRRWTTPSLAENLVLGRRRRRRPRRRPDAVPAALRLGMGLKIFTPARCSLRDGHRRADSVGRRSFLGGPPPIEPRRAGADGRSGDRRPRRQRGVRRRAGFLSARSWSRSWRWHLVLVSWRRAARAASPQLRASSKRARSPCTCERSALYGANEHLIALRKGVKLRVGPAGTRSFLLARERSHGRSAATTSLPSPPKGSTKRA